MRTQSLDDFDLALLERLRANARSPVSSLAVALAASRTKVQHRIKRLEERGVIIGYTINTPALLGAGEVRAVVMVCLHPQRGADTINALRHMGAIRKLYTISGAFDLCAIATAQDTEKIDETLDEIRAMPGVRDTLSSILLSTKVDR
ncbi:MAG: Lrp/AsnC family transcriptional regulator [Alphaproteobacteria bacterium]